MMFFSVVFRLGASPDSSTTTPPSPVELNWSFKRESSRPREETFDPTVTNVAGMHPLYLFPIRFRNSSVPLMGYPYVSNEVDLTKVEILS